MSFRNKIMKLILLLHIIFLSNQQITTGIYKIIEGIRYPIVFDANEEYYNVICSTKYYVYHKVKNNLKSHGSSNFNNYSPLLLFQDQENNYLVLTSNKLYSITLNINKEISQINYFSNEITNFQIFGYISEGISSSSISENTDSNLKEIIAYGKEEDNLYFYYRVESQLKTAELRIKEEIEDYLSCKIYKNDYFICAFNTLNFFKICLFFAKLTQMYVMS